MGFLQRRLLKAVLAVVEYPRTTLAIAAAVLAACIMLAVTRLGMSTDQNKLFSANVKFFHDFLEFNRKFPENEAMYVLIEPADPRKMPDVARWTNLADAITDRLRKLTQYIAAVDERVPLERPDFPAILFEEPAKIPGRFEQIKRFVPLAQFWAQKPSGLTALIGPTPMNVFLAGLVTQPVDVERATFVNELSSSWVKASEHPLSAPSVPDLSKLEVSDPSELGYYYQNDESEQKDKSEPPRHLLLIQVYVKGNESSLSAGSEMIGAVRDAIAEAGKDYPEFTAGVTGRPALDADEGRTTDTDSKRAEIIASIVVFIGLAVTLRSLWLALVAEISLAVGIGWTFGYATLAVGELNLLSLVFLIALIGIGMDYLIQILTRYRREARRYTRPEAVWTRVFRYVSPPILTACLGAAGAFFVSDFTDFRGAAELGIIAGGGLLLCLLAGYTVLPAILVLLPPKLTQIDPEARYGLEPPVVRSTLRRLILPAVWVVGLVALMPFASRASFNPNLLELQAPNLESVQLVKKLQTWSAVVLSHDLATLRKVRDAMAGAATVKRTESILSAYDNFDWLQHHKSELPAIEWTEPAEIRAGNLATIADQARSLADHFQRAGSAATAPAEEIAPFSAVASTLRHFADDLSALPATERNAVAQSLTQWQIAFVDELHRLIAQIIPASFEPLTLPREIRDHFVSTVDPGPPLFALYIYPTGDLWKREPLAEFVGDVERRTATVTGDITVTGIASDIFHSTHAIEISFYKATAYALALVVVLVFLDMRSIPRTLMTVSVLGLGLPMLVGIMGLFNKDWNFANFFALPILIGAGHEYGVFMVHRYQEVLHNPRRVWRSWDVSDRAMLLCAFVTSSSFGFFWALGHHRGLMSLGFVMAVGTACIYLAAVMVVRPLLKWRLERMNGSGSGDDEKQTH